MMSNLSLLIFVVLFNIINAANTIETEADYGQNKKKRCQADGTCIGPTDELSSENCKVETGECVSINSLEPNKCEFVTNIDESIILCADMNNITIKDSDNVFDLFFDSDHFLSSSCFIPQNKVKNNTESIIYDYFCNRLGGTCSNEAKCIQDSNAQFQIEKIRHLRQEAMDETLQSSLLLAFDGTGSRSQFESDNKNDPKHDKQKYKSLIGIESDPKWIWRSHVSNFWEDYEGDSYYWYGPDANEMFVADHECQYAVKQGHDTACKFLQNLFESYTELGTKSAMELAELYFVDIIGFSRGGFIAMELARRLQFDGCQINDVLFKPIYIRWMGLYDPVKRTLELVPPTYNQHAVASTVSNVSIAERCRKTKSRRYFGYGTDEGCENDENSENNGNNECCSFCKKEFYGTSHSGVGGAPGEGDCKQDCDFEDLLSVDSCIWCNRDYTILKDKKGSLNVDIWMRQNAVSNDVPIRPTDDAFYAADKDEIFVAYQ